MFSASYKLDNNGIKNSTEEIEKFLSSNDIPSSEILHTTIASEEVLLNYLNEFGSAMDFSINYIKSFGKLRIELVIACEEFNPFANQNDEEGYIIHNLMMNTGLEPSWIYKRKTNRIIFLIERKRQISMIAQIIAAIILGMGLGLLSTNMSENTVSVINQKLLLPVSDTIMGFLTTSASILIFLSVINGICSMGDISTFNKIGRKTITRFLKMLLIYAAIGFAAVLPFFSITFDSSNGIDFAMLYNLILDIVPDNLLSPFISGNMLQLIFIAVCMGIFLLILENKADGIRSLVSQGNMLFRSFVEAIIKLMPIVVFISMYSLASEGNLKTILSSLKIILLFILAEAVILTVVLLRVCISRHISPGLLFKKMLPALIIAFSTSSFVAAYPKTQEIVADSYGVDKKLAEMGIPMGQIMLTPEDISCFVCISLCMAEVYNIGITPGWLITLGITAFFLALAAPPIVGVYMSCIGVLFAQLGIPMEAIAIVAALDPIIDRISTSAMLITIHSEMIMLGSSLDLIDEEILKKDSF